MSLQISKQSKIKLTNVGNFTNQMGNNLTDFLICSLAVNRVAHIVTSPGAMFIIYESGLSQICNLLSILTSVWELHTANAGQNILSPSFSVFFQYFEAKIPVLLCRLAFGN